MLITKESKKFENQESRLNYLISQMKGNLNSEEVNRIYNRMLLERAVLRNKATKTKKKNFLTTLCRKLTGKNKEKLICDYFKN